MDTNSSSASLLSEELSCVYLDLEKKYHESVLGATASFITENRSKGMSDNEICGCIQKSKKWHNTLMQIEPKQNSYVPLPKDFGSEDLLAWLTIKWPERFGRFCRQN